MPENKPIRVRIAPSPTGHLHLGTVRTALYNYLFAKKERGVFIVRTEDTDPGRSLAIYEQEILSGLRSLGIIWDEGPDIGGPYGPYRQTERNNIYKSYIQKLLDEKKAYYCFCSKEDLEKQRSAMLASGIAPKYPGTCRHLSKEEIAQHQKNKSSSVIRLVVHDGIDISFNDLIRGKISVMSDTIGGDIVIARDENTPLFYLANVIDDYEMKISHVIRGEEHISNTPKQILIQRALELPEIQYAHLPLILTPERKKMSKRSATTTEFAEYLRNGYLPEALLNFLALLGWMPEDGKEILTLPEMIERFSLKRIQKAGAAFNIDKLNWFNAQYIKALPIEVLQKRIESFIPSEWKKQPHILTGALALERERIKTLAEFKENASFFFLLEDYETTLLIWDKSSLNAASEHLSYVRQTLDTVNVWNKEKLEEVIMPYAEKKGRGEVLWPLRVALCGKRNSPGPFEIMNVLGKKESLRRIDYAITKIAGDLAVPNPSIKNGF